jgi:hypothetical protein
MLRRDSSDQDLTIGGEKMNGNNVTQEQVDAIFMASTFDVTTHFGKVTILTMMLPNGFTLVESSGCVDPANYCQHTGVRICEEKLRSRVWYHLGYELQLKNYGSFST